MWLAMALILLAYLSVAVVGNRWGGAFRVEESRELSQKRPEASGTVSVVCWNLGYGGLGAESSFVADGGDEFLPRSAAAVEANVAGLRKTVGEINADVFLFQEVAGPSLMNRRVDLKQRVSQALEAYSYAYSPDVRTWLIPPPLSISVGNASYCRLRTSAIESIPLPVETGFYAGVLKNHYRILVSRLPIAGRPSDLVIANVHLAAFDKGADTRMAQLAAVMRFAEEEYSKGNFVVVGGDWNLRLAQTDFPHSTPDKFLFWLADFPKETLPPRWKTVCDGSTPSVRTLHKSYVAGENYTCVIDGFVVSPNVRAVSVRTVDCGFKHSDHNPVVAEFELGE